MKFNKIEEFFSLETNYNTLERIDERKLPENIASKLGMGRGT